MKLSSFLGLALACALAPTSQAGQLIANGGFESSFTGWTVLDQIGGDGSFLLQTGTLSPVNGFTVSAPPGGVNAAMTDSQGPGSHILYQDFVVPVVAGSYSLSFQLFLSNGAEEFTIPDPASLDFATPALNQQFRVDIISTSADPFSVAPADVLQNVYQTQTGDPLQSGYLLVSADLTGLVAANPGQTLRLRFAEVDNVNFFNAGIDDVSLTDESVSVPEPSTAIAGAALLGLLLARRRKR